MKLNYKINNVPIENYGAVATLGRGRIALDGLFDMPKRIGATEYVWGTSVEPFVNAEDIRLDGRLLTLNTAMRHEKVNDFIQACFACTTFSVDFDSFEVVCRDEIEVERVGEFSKVVVKFYNPTPPLPQGDGGIPRGIVSDWMIDNFSLKDDFGIYISEATRMRNGGKRIEVNTTEFYTKTAYRSSMVIDLHCFMKADTIRQLYENMKQFQALLASQGLRKLKAKNDTFEIYFKDGLKAEYLSDYFIGFNLKGIVI